MRTPRKSKTTPSPSYNAVHTALHALADPEKAKFLSRFFKTGKGEYGEGDRFLGITVPLVRDLAKKHASLSLADTERLLHSPYNEERLLALLILGKNFHRGDETTRKAVCRLYLRNLAQVNNWNLVDSSAPYILGAYLHERSRAPLYKLVVSKNLWRRRVAIISTFAMIRAGEFEDTLKIATALLGDEHDLIHKACGWMLREVGKRDIAELESFLRRHHRRMPRTMLRYAIERLPEPKRKAYLNGLV